MPLRSLLLSLVLIPLFSACGQQSAPGKTSADTSADTAALRANVEKFLTAWNKGDTATYAAMLAPDAILMSPDEPLLQGRDAIAARMAKDYDISKAQQTATVDEVIVMENHAYVRGAWSVSPTAAGGADTQGATGKWSALYQRGPDGNWLTSRWMWNQKAALKPNGG